MSDQPDKTKGPQPAKVVGRSRASTGAGASAEHVTKAVRAPRAGQGSRRRSPAGPKSTTAGSLVLERPTTLAIDIGGTGMKAVVLDAGAKLVADRVRVPTPYPCSPKVLIDALGVLCAPLPAFDRASVGFPGVVRKGVVITAPHFVTLDGKPGGEVVAELRDAWAGFDITGGLTSRFGRPVRVANDAELQGLEVISGVGLELVLTLGTGVGSALFFDGRLMPHLEVSQHPFRKAETYDQQIGNSALLKLGAKKWRKRVELAFECLDRLINYDRLYVGGGNSRLLVGHVDPSVVIVDNIAGLLGGIKLWELEGG